MKVVLIVLAFVGISAAAKVFSCDQGCKDDGECPNNSHCVAINQNSECGMCLCKAGYKSQGNDCVPNKPQKSQKGGGSGSKSSKETTTASSAAPTTSGAAASSAQQTAAASTSGPVSTQPTTAAGPTTQGPPPAPGPITCSEFNCAPVFPSSNDDNPFTVRAAIYNETAGCKNKLANSGRTCKMQGGGVCYGVYCLTVDSGNDYCICEYNRIDRQCAVEKPGKCDSATATLPQTAFKVQNKRYRNKNSPDNGSVYARHFAASFDDCVKLCTWAAGSCRSINYGTIAGQQVCELLSTLVTKGSLLEPWLVDAQGWQYAQVATQ